MGAMVCPVGKNEIEVHKIVAAEAFETFVVLHQASEAVLPDAPGCNQPLDQPAETTHQHTPAETAHQHTHMYVHTTAIFAVISA